VRSYRDAGVMSLDRGVWLEFSDGAVFGLTVSVSHRAAQPGTVRPPKRQHPSRRPLRRHTRPTTGDTAG
jgi:hypothetical protein